MRIRAALCALALATLCSRAQAEDPGTLAPDSFIDGDRHTRSASGAYRKLHAPQVPHHLRAVLQDLTYVAVGTTWYWLAREQNLVDWDRPSARKRFTLDVIRFDNNEFPINFTLHPWSGSAYYTAARTNGMSIAASSGYALGATVLWEYGIEFREKVSINDLITTPVAGITIGEFFSRLAMYTNRPAGAPRLGHRIAGWVLGPLQAFSDLFDDGMLQTGGPADNLGYSADVHHRFVLRSGVTLQDTRSQVLSDTVLDGWFVNIPSYRKPGRFRRFLHDGDFTRFWLQHTQGQGDREFDSYADLTLLGMYEQRMDSAQRGGSFFLGSSLGYRYRRSLFRGFRDEVSATHLPGVAIDATLSAGGVKLHLSYRLHPDFAGIRSLSYPDYQAAHPDAQGKTTLASHGYLFGFGISSLLEATLELPYARVGVRSWFAYYNSTEGLDRKQEELTVDPQGVERVLDAEGFVQLLPWPGAPYFFELRVLTRRRASVLAGYTEQARLTRAGLSLGVQF